MCRSRLGLIALRHIAADAMAIRREERWVRAFIEEFEQVGDVRGKADYLVAMTDDAPASVTVPGIKAARARFVSSDLLRSLAIVLKLARATPPAALYDQGVIPTDYAMRAYRLGRQYDAAETADLVVRIALLGTFIGIIAALSIASGGLSASRGSGPNQLGEMQLFMQQLLATAATKFWISAAGLAVAILLRTVDKIFLRQVERLRAELGDVTDRLLHSAEFTAEFCKPVEASGDPIRDQLRAIADQIKASADSWVLTVQIGGAGAKAGPSVNLVAAAGPAT